MVDFNHDHMTIIDDMVVLDEVYFNGMNLEEWVAPIPGLPCLTG